MEETGLEATRRLAKRERMPEGEKKGPYSRAILMDIHPKLSIFSPS
jgi:hypothetical protein